MAGSFVFRNLEKLVSPTQAHRRTCFNDFEIVEKAQMRGRITKKAC